MDRLKNPYTPGAGTPPPALTGRQEELEAFEVLIGRLSARHHENSLILYGLRGVGKTVLLGEMGRIARREGWQGLSIEARARMDFEQTLAREVHQAIRKLRPVTSIAKAAVARAFRALRSLEVTYGERGLTLGIGSESEPGLADTGDLEADLVEVLEVAGEAAQQSRSGLLIFVDEMQLMTPSILSALVESLHKASQTGRPLAVVGAGLPQLPTKIAEAKTYAERLFTYRRIDSLARVAAQEALEIPARDTANATFQSSALEEILDRSGCYPYFLQVYGKRVWDAAVGPEVTRNDVLVVAPKVQDELDAGFFYVRWEKATPKEREYMRAMANGTGPQATATVASQMGALRASDVSPHRDNLIKKGLIYAPDHGAVDFTAPLFGDYVRRRHT